MAQLFGQSISFLTFTILVTILGYTSRAKADLNQDVLFYLYTPKTPDTPYLLNLTNPNSLTDAGYDPTLPLTVLCHGFTQNYLSAPSPNMILRPAYFNCPATRNRNVVAIDWSKNSGDPNPPIAGLNLDYAPAAEYTLRVGLATAQFLDILVRFGTPLSQIHLIGFSLGGPSMGFAGMYYKLLFGRKVDRITALDHAGPCFDPSRIVEAVQCDGLIRWLEPEDAIFVQAIHTGALYYGSSQAVGHVDFFMNGGYAQPGCGLDDLISRCSHRKSLLYYAESICNPNGFKSTCSLLDALTVGCKLNVENKMGEHVDRSSQGKFLAKTNQNSPYSQSG